MGRFSRRGGYSGFSKPAIMESSGIQSKRRSKCAGCGGRIEVGDSYVRLRLQKRYRVPCTSCHHQPKGAKRFHPQCKPMDINKAMGYDPNTTYAPPPKRGATVAPPPMPASADDEVYAAFIGIQRAVKARCRENPALLKQIETDFSTFQKLTKLALRPGVDTEGVAAMRAALTRAIKLVF